MTPQQIEQLEALEKECLERLVNWHDRHMWGLVRWCQRRNKGWPFLSEIFGCGSTVAEAIWEKYINMPAEAVAYEPRAALAGALEAAQADARRLDALEQQLVVARKGTPMTWMARKAEDDGLDISSWRARGTLRDAIDAALNAGETNEP